MKLTLNMILDETAESGATLSGSKSTADRELSGFRIASGILGLLDPSYLYFIDSSLSAVAARQTETICFAVSGGNAETLPCNSAHSALVFPKEISTLSIFSLLQSIWDKYANWELDAMNAILSKRPTQEVLDKIAFLLINPFAIFDEFQAMVYKAGFIPDNTKGSIWEVVLTKGYTPPEILPIKERRVVDAHNRLDKPPHLYKANLADHEENWLMCGLFVHGHFWGTMGSVDVATPFTQGQMTVACHAKHLIELALENEFEIGDASGTPYYIERLLNGYDISRHIVEYHLSHRRWASLGQFWMIRFTHIGDMPVPGDALEKYLPHIKTIQPKAMTVIYEQGIVSIGRVDDQKAADKDIETLLKRFGLISGISMEFYDFMGLKHAYIQCKAALFCGRATLNFFSDNYLACLKVALSQTTSLKSLCHPGILRCLTEDGNRGREYVDCLSSYLSNGCNLAATAQKLHLHRNTLSYRLERMSANLGVDLRTCDDNTLFILQFSCLIADTALHGVICNQSDST
ncbi:MAG: helix-turn-helix domain-containing protein [Clostridiales bacterium]|jgi:hypothetical protein|nr:helix-turn-helix domain-containing protein [Clostridiales bacterium]